MDDRRCNRGAGSAGGRRTAQRTGLAAVPFLLPGVPARLRATKSEIVRDMGDDLPSQLRRRRKSLGILQREAAQMMGVCKDAAIKWERGFVQPEDRLYPAIIAFLGRPPWPEPRT